MIEYLSIAGESLLNGLVLCLEVAAIIIPLLIVYELAKGYGVFEKPWPGVTPLMSRLGLGQGALVPLLAGMFLGLIYGAGIMLAMSREQALSLRERLTLALFLSACHAVIEDTAIFVLLGGSGLWILGPRLVLALALCLLLSRTSPHRVQ